jgi:hypothetical protein
MAEGRPGKNQQITRQTVQRRWFSTAAAAGKRPTSADWRADGRPPQWREKTRLEDT